MLHLPAATVSLFLSFFFPLLVCCFFHTTFPLLPLSSSFNLLFCFFFLTFSSFPFLASFSTFYFSFFSLFLSPPSFSSAFSISTYSFSPPLPLLLSLLIHPLTSVLPYSSSLFPSSVPLPSFHLSTFPSLHLSSLRYFISPSC